MGRNQGCCETSYDAQGRQTKKELSSYKCQLNQKLWSRAEDRAGLLGQCTMQSHRATHWAGALGLMRAVTRPPFLIILFLTCVLYMESHGTMELDPGTWTLSSCRVPFPITCLYPWIPRTGCQPPTYCSCPWRRLGAVTEKVVIGHMHPVY